MELLRHQYLLPTSKTSYSPASAIPTNMRVHLRGTQVSIVLPKRDSATVTIITAYSIPTSHRHNPTKRRSSSAQTPAPSFSPSKAHSSTEDDSI